MRNAGGGVLRSDTTEREDRCTAGGCRGIVKRVKACTGDHLSPMEALFKDGAEEDEIGTGERCAAGLLHAMTGNAEQHGFANCPARE